MCFRRTDFPHPEGPKITKVSPGSTVRVRSRRTWFAPKNLLSRWTSTRTPGTVRVSLSALAAIRIVVIVPRNRNQALMAVTSACG